MNGIEVLPPPKAFRHAACSASCLERMQLVPQFPSTNSHSADLCRPPIDLRELERDFDDAGIDELIGMFGSECRPLLTQIETAIAVGNMSALRKASHQLRGAAGNFGADDLIHACENLECSSIRGTLRCDSPVMASVSEEFKRVEAALRRVRLS